MYLKVPRLRRAIREKVEELVIAEMRGFDNTVNMLLDKGIAAHASECAQAERDIAAGRRARLARRG
jgi:hypothetical protein